MNALTQTPAQKTFFEKLLAFIGGFFGHLVTGAETAFKHLSQQQQQAIENGVNISQIMKDGYTKGEDFVVNEVVTATGVPKEVAQQLILTALKDVRINVTSIQAGFNQLADQIQSGITDTDWNSLWKTVATSAAQWLSTGSLNWVSLSMGLIEWAFQHFIASKKAA